MNNTQTPSSDLAYFAFLQVFNRKFNLVLGSFMGQPLPEIDYDAFRFIDTPNLTGTPERRLLLAILERAILDYVGNDEKEVEESSEWIFSDDEENHFHGPFTFSWLCQELDLQKEDIREKIRLMPKRGPSRIAPWYMTRH